MTNCVVLFSSVERLDENDPQKVIDTATHDVIHRLNQVKVTKVVIFPYAHLTSTLSTPTLALQVLKGLEESLKSHGLEVKRAPFGWYKEYDIKSTGHPLSELSMTICPYEGGNCDFLCPYCANPIKVKDMTHEENAGHQNVAPRRTMLKRPPEATENISDMVLEVHVSKALNLIDYVKRVTNS